MTAVQILQSVLQIVALFPEVEPSLVRAIQDFESLFSDNGEPSQADIDALIARVTQQSVEIQQIASHTGAQ